MSTGHIIPVAGFTRVTALTLFVYDWVLTLDDEISLIWVRRAALAAHALPRSHLTILVQLFRWTRATIVFLIIRYLSLSVLILDAYVGLKTGLSPQRCQTYGSTASSSSIVVVVLVQGVLQLRLYLMYNRKRTILWVNGALYVVQIAVWIASLFLGREQPHIRVPPEVIGSCYILIDSQRAAVAWVPAMVFETVMAAQALYRVWREPRIRGPAILASLVRDSVTYFFLLLFIIIAVIALFLTNPLDPGYAASGLVTAVASIGGTRIILSMRHILTVPSEDYTLQETGAHIELGFVRDDTCPRPREPRRSAHSV